MTIEVINIKPLVIQAGKRYVMRYGGITAPIKRSKTSTHEGYYWTDGLEDWYQSGTWGCDEDERDLIAEYTQPEPLSFPLVAGGKYETVTCGSVELRTPAHFAAVYLTAYPFECVAESNPCCVTADGYLVQIKDGVAIDRIVRPYIEPKPPTHAEKLQQAISLLATARKDDEAFALIRGVIAGLKAEQSK